MELNDNHISIVKKYEYINLDIQEIDYIFDKCIKDCYNKYFQPIRNICLYNIELTIISNNNIINLSISDKFLTMNELNKNLSIARQRGYIFNKINKLTKKFYDHLSQTNIHNYYKIKCPLLIRQILKIISRDPDSIQKFSNIFHNLEFYIL